MKNDVGMLTDSNIIQMSYNKQQQTSRTDVIHECYIFCSAKLSLWSN